MHFPPTGKSFRFHRRPAKHHSSAFGIIESEHFRDIVTLQQDQAERGLCRPPFCEVSLGGQHRLRAEGTQVVRQDVKVKLRFKGEKSSEASLLIKVALL